ncbi:MAG TPA: hypothetical protein PLX88_01440 [Syntrophorhabdaceae bacterium]|nr:hypothetical protein [Syntrophorhabdaceae bacterium]MDI9560917.1 hypothetical protein [Pseudomonadota bacterium]MBP8697809.1 hypothetical protein [Syntrophorhabdaceae bacterium]HNQ62436.1 hypothetical protein [Syntrophorhabdaceae bacterium]HNZ58329.1 hypothetical protein [Syntrophorhabdaceae bacterium]
MNKKAIALLSGGLDSVLAVKLIIDQEIKVVALHFTSPFSSKRDKIKGLQAERAARELGIRLILIHKGMEYVDVVKTPKHGYGKNMNPCIDCRCFMLKKTKELMAKEDAGFVVTGEVLGQRPMSQRRDAIHIIERESGLTGLIVRPLSARHFQPSIPETEGIIDRSRLLNISGRSRETQYKLVKLFNLNEYSSPGGGCLLTDEAFSRKLRDLFFYDKNFNMQDVEFLSIGRHFRLSSDTKLIIGRNETENERLVAHWQKPYILLCPSDFSGPVGIIKGAYTGENIAVSANIIGSYAKYNSNRITLEINNKEPEKHIVNRFDVDIDKLKI